MLVTNIASIFTNLPKTNINIQVTFNSLPNHKFLDWSKFKAFADNKKIFNLTIENLLGMVENITSIFSFSYNVFKRLLFQGCKKSGLGGRGLICHLHYALNLDQSKTLSFGKGSRSQSLPSNKVFDPLTLS